MASPKTSEFKAQDAELARFASALSHPARVAILKALAARKGCVCGVLVDLMPLAQSTVSQHLKVLKEAGLIQGEVDGPKCCYCINPVAVKRFTSLFNNWLEEMPAVKGKSCGRPR